MTGGDTRVTPIRGRSGRSPGAHRPIRTEHEQKSSPDCHDLDAASMNRRTLNTALIAAALSAPCARNTNGDARRAAGLGSRTRVTAAVLAGHRRSTHAHVIRHQRQRSTEPDSVTDHSARRSGHDRDRHHRCLGRVPRRPVQVVLNQHSHSHLSLRSVPFLRTVRSLR